jgi:uncharacterized protein YabE (DUF348 family)
MKKIFNKSVMSSRAFVTAVILLVILSVISVSSISRADDGDELQNGRLITIYDRGSEKVILSQASTIGDALKEAGVAVDVKDAVEPAVTEKLVASDYQVNIYRARPVIIVDGNLRTKINTPYQTAVQIIESAGIKLYDEDKTILERTDDIVAEGAGLKLTIDRAALFNFDLFGKTTAARTHGDTVGEMLNKKGIKLTVSDRVLPDKNAKLTEDMTVRVWREGKQTITVDESVDFDIEKIENADQPVSFREVKTVGVKGSRSVSYEITIQNGIEVSRVEIASITTVKPIKQIEVVDAKGQYTTPTENENITWDFLISNGFSRVQAVGIMGNLMQEHHFRTSGDGIAQWTGGRKAELYSMPHPNNIYTQLDFLLHELTTNYSKVGNAIKASDSLVDVTLIFQNQFERCNPAYCMQNNRITYARNILASH